MAEGRLPNWRRPDRVLANRLLSPFPSRSTLHRTCRFSSGPKTGGRRSCFRQRPFSSFPYVNVGGVGDCAAFAHFPIIRYPSLAAGGRISGGGGQSRKGEGPRGVSHFACPGVVMNVPLSPSRNGGRVAIRHPPPPPLPKDPLCRPRVREKMPPGHASELRRCRPGQLDLLPPLSLRESLELAPASPKFPSGGLKD